MITFAEFQKIKRCFTGNRYYIAALSETMEIERQARFYNAAMLRERLTGAAKHLEKMNKAKESQRGYINRFEEHLGECTQCVSDAVSV